MSNQALNIIDVIKDPDSYSREIVSRAMAALPRMVTDIAEKGQSWGWSRVWDREGGNLFYMPRCYRRYIPAAYSRNYGKKNCA